MTTPTDSGIVTDEGLVERVADAIWPLADWNGDRLEAVVAARNAIAATGILALTRTLADERKRIGELEAVMREVLPYLEEAYLDDEDDDEPVGWQSDHDGTNQRPVALTFGMIRRFRASLSQRPTEGEAKA